MEGEDGMRKRIEKLRIMVLSLIAMLMLGGCTGKSIDVSQRTTGVDASFESTNFLFEEEMSLVCVNGSCMS